MVGEHQLNRRSSRSHCIYTFHITRTRVMEINTTNTTKSNESSDVTQSKLHLVDLAGSERIEKTRSTGTLQKEASHINRSLLYLEQVVLSLSQTTKGKSDHIPYRQSKLTYLLKDSLGGNCST